MSIAPPSLASPIGDRHTAAPAAPRTTHGIESAAPPRPATKETSPVAAARANRIDFDEKSGLRVVHTVDLKTGEIVGQNPSEAYLRLAHAMIATLRADVDEGSGADLIA